MGYTCLRLHLLPIQGVHIDLVLFPMHHAAIFQLEKVLGLHIYELLNFLLELVSVKSVNILHFFDKLIYPGFDPHF